MEKVIKWGIAGAGKKHSDIMPISESIRILQQMDYIRKQIKLQYPFEV